MTIAEEQPPRILITPVNHGYGNRWRWQIVSHFGDEKESKYQWAYWRPDGDWDYRSVSHAEYCEGETFTRWGAERQARRSLRRLRRTLAHIAQDEVEITDGGAR